VVRPSEGYGSGIESVDEIQELVATTVYITTSTNFHMAEAIQQSPIIPSTLQMLRSFLAYIASQP